MSALPAANRHFVDTNVWLYVLITGQDATKAQRARAFLTVHRYWHDVIRRVDLTTLTKLGKALNLDPRELLELDEADT